MSIATPAFNEEHSNELTSSSVSHSITSTESRQAERAEENIEEPGKPTLSKKNALGPSSSEVSFDVGNLIETVFNLQLQNYGIQQMNEALKKQNELVNKGKELKKKLKKI